MKRWTRATRAWAADEAAVISIEYAMLGGLIAVVSVVAVTGVGDNVNTLLAGLCNEVTQAIIGAPAG